MRPSTDLEGGCPRVIDILEPFFQDFPKNLGYRRVENLD